MRDRGLALITTLWIVAVLSILATEYLYIVYLDRQIGRGLVTRIQYEYVARAGIAHWIRRLVQEDDATVDTANESWAQTLEGVLEDPEIQTALYRYTVEASDENARINLNEADEPLLRRVLEAAGAPQEQLDTLIQNILSERDRAPFLTVGDLVRVEGITPELLYGAEATTQLSLPTQENTEQTAPLINLLTVYSVDKNVQQDGSERTNIATADANALRNGLTDSNGNQLLSQGEADAIVAYRQQNPFDNVGELMQVPAVTQSVLDGAREQLSTEDEEDKVNINTASVDELAQVNGFDRGIAEDIVRHRNENGNFNSVDDLREVRVFSRDEIKAVIDKATIVDDAVIAGLVNVNTASAEVLALLPGMDANLANAIVQYRQGGGSGAAPGGPGGPGGIPGGSAPGNGSQGNPFDTIGELLDVPGMSDATFQQLTSWVTYRSQAFRLVARGQTEDGQDRVTITTVLDRSGSEIQTRYWVKNGASK